MKTLGLIGGTSWVSTVDYYRYINQLANEKRGGLNYAQILLYSISFNDVKTLADAGDWENLGLLLRKLPEILKRQARKRLYCALIRFTSSPKKLKKISKFRSFILPMRPRGKFCGEI